MMYLLQVNLYTAALVLIYVLFLKNRPLFSTGRVYLIVASVLPLVLPLLTLPGAMQQKLQGTVFQVTLPAISVNVQKHTPVLSTHFSAWWVYSIIALSILIRGFIGVSRLRKIIANSNCRKFDSYTLLTSTGYGPGSFGKYIFFPGADVNQTILAHEQAHISRGHTADIILLSLLNAVCWPNIFLHWIKKEIKELHEFEADAMVQADTDEYAQLLLCSVFNTTSLPLLHTFIHHPLKRRIMMLQKKNSTASPLKAIVCVAASLSLVVVTGASVQSCNKTGNNPKQVAATDAAKKQPDGLVYATADVMPSYKGEKDALMNDLVRNLKYPEYARSKNIEGRVIVKFIVSKYGNIMNAQVIRSPDTSLSRAAVDAVSKLNGWQPGHMNNGENVDVWFYLPVSFKME